MKKIISLLFFLSLFSSNICFSQSGWFWQHPYPQGNNLSSGCIFNNNNIIAVGGAGTIVVTTNCGINWKITNNIYDMKQSLNSVFFVDSLTGWACGGTDYYLTGLSKILKTTDGGLNWNVQLSGSNLGFNSIYFINKNIGWAVGNINLFSGNIFKTTNGGVNWAQLNSPSNYPIYSVFFVDSLIGWIADWYLQVYPGGSHSTIQIFKSTNGGIEWIQQYYLYEDNTFRKLNEIFFTDSQLGWVVGNDRLLKTTNGGTNWIYTNIWGNSIHFINSMTGWKLTSSSIEKTTNSGNNWFVQSSIGGNKVTFYDMNNGCIFSNNSRIYKTSNGGMNWNELSYIQASWLEDIFFVNQNTGYCVGNDGIVLKTTNSGQQWLLNNVISSSYLTSIYFINANTGWIGSSFDRIFKTTDAGNNWFSQLNVSFNVDDILFVNQNKGFASGGYQKLLYTTNSGLNWSFQNISINYVYDIYEIDSLNLLISGGGNQPYIMKSTNGGSVWYSINNTSSTIYSMDFINSSTGFCCGGLGHVYRTTDSGWNWVQIQTLEENSLTSLRFFSNSEGIILGGLTGMIFHTSNGGNTWDSSYLYSGQLRSTFSLNDSLVWIVGGNGTILHTRDLGHVFLSVNEKNNSLPLFFSLSQNYPNPFNPVTKIKYDIPPSKGARGMITKLIIYDILGREIETLVNETQKPGSYEVAWDGSRYASGVYFYRLMTDEYTETKKMVLIK